METTFLPNWFLQRLSDGSLTRLEVAEVEPTGVWARVDEETARMWRRAIERGRKPLRKEGGR